MIWSSGQCDQERYSWQGCWGGDDGDGGGGGDGIEHLAFPLKNAIHDVLRLTTSYGWKRKVLMINTINEIRPKCWDWEARSMRSTVCRSSYPQCTVLVSCIPTHSHVRTSFINISLIVEMHIVWTENMQYDTISKGGVDCAQNPWQRPWENCVEECLGAIISLWHSAELQSVQCNVDWGAVWRWRMHEEKIGGEELGWGQVGKNWVEKGKSKLKCNCLLFG